jgi:hypothetical protein
MVAGFITAFFVVMLATSIGYWRGFRAGKKSLGLLESGDPLLREAEAEVEALLAGLPPGEREQKRLALEAPKRRIRKHPCLSPVQVRAIMGLLADEFTVLEIEWMLVDGIEPPTGGRPAQSSHWTGSANMIGTITGYKGRWNPPKNISPLTWAYLVRVIEKRPHPADGWVFQKSNGYSLERGDVLVCAPADDVKED